MLPITTYVINLKRRPVQFRYFLENNKGLPLNIIRFEAIDGLDENNKQAKISGKNPVHKQEKHGKFGCFLSHLEVLKKIAKMDPSQWVFITEDDAIISPDLFNVWNEIVRETNEYNIDILFLSRNYVSDDTFLYPPSPEGKLCIVKINGFFCGTHFYMVNAKGAQKILRFQEMNPYESIPYDIAFGNAAKRTQTVYAIIRLDKNFKKSSIPSSIPSQMYDKNIMGYATLSGTMGSSTEEYFENIREFFVENKDMSVSLIVVLILVFIGIVISAICVCFEN